MFQLPAFVTLPEGAQLDQAFTQVTNLTLPANNGGLIYRTPGQYYDLIVSLATNFVTGAVVGDRLGFIQIADDRGDILLNSPAPVVQQANKAGFYSWVTSASTAIGVGPTGSFWFEMVPMPLFALYPGYNIQIGWPGIQAGDASSFVTATIIHIPTNRVGSALTADTPSSTPTVVTPLLV